MAHVADSTVGHIANLAEPVASQAWWLVFIVRTAGFPLQITSTVRTRAVQEALVRAGLSRAKDSLHLDGKAFDVDIHGYGRDEVPRWFWYELGDLAERLGLVWGGRFANFWDPGHFEARR